MPLARLDNFLKNLNGNTLYVDPNELDSTDSIDNRGNSRTRPFKTIQRALLEAARFSYVPGTNNDLFDQTTILLSAATHYIDNRPGYCIASDRTSLNDINGTARQISEFSINSNFDINDTFNELYIYNSVNGGVIVPKGVSIVANDLRKTKIRPKFVPSPNNSNILKSAIFRLTGASYIFGFTIFDGDPLGKVYNTYSNSQVSSNFSHHKLTVFEYADGKNNFIRANGVDTGFTDLDTYYYKVSLAYGNLSGRSVIDGYSNLQKNPEETKIVGDLGQGSVNITSLISGDGLLSPSRILTITTESDHNLSPFASISITGVGQNDGNLNVASTYNGLYVVYDIQNSKKFTTLIEEIPSVTPAPSVIGASLRILSDTVNSSSPYIFNCSLKSVYGMNGLHADGSKATGFKSMVTAQFTGISLQKDDNAFVKYDSNTSTYKDQSAFGTNLFLHQDTESRYKPEYSSSHIKVSNDAFVQCVSIFAIGYDKQFVANSGGDQSITNSNSNFGSISLYANGFRSYSQTKDNAGYITHIISPKDVSLVENNINCYSIDVQLTQSQASSNSNSRIYFRDYANNFELPSSKVKTYFIGARLNDKIYYLNGAVENSATIAKNYKLSKLISSIDVASNTITISNTTDLAVNQSVRISSKNAILPDGIEHSKLYYINSISGNNIKLSRYFDGPVLDIKNTRGVSSSNLAIISNVSDKISGSIGSPIQWDSVNSRWYILITASSNFISGLTGLTSSTFYIKRLNDSRSLDDKIYKLRYFIPKEATNAIDPKSGFIVQKSSSDLDSSYSQPNSIELSLISNRISSVRNTGIIIDAFATTVGILTTATIVAREPHHLKTGNLIEIYNLKSLNEPNPVGLGTGTGFNGEFYVTSVPNPLSFTFAILRNPGNIVPINNTTVTSWGYDTEKSSYRIPPYTIKESNRNNLPYFKCKSLNNQYQFYNVDILQPYVKDSSDGIYHITLNAFKNSPNIAPFESDEFKLSQSLENLYPTLDYDNINSDVDASFTLASREIIGKVNINDESLSVTKETLTSYLKDIENSIDISNISVSGTNCTITTPSYHLFGRISSLIDFDIPGVNYVDGNYYDLPLVISDSNQKGFGATVNVTVFEGRIVKITLQNAGFGYVAPEILLITGIPGSNDDASVVIQTTNDNFSIQVIGSVNSANNGSFPVVVREDVSLTNSITFKNPIAVAETSSNAVALVFPGYVISSRSYNSVTNQTIFGTTTSHSFSVGSRVYFKRNPSENLTSSYYITTVTANTFALIGDLTSLIAVSDIVYIYGITSNIKNTGLENENLNSRCTTIFGGVQTFISSEINSTLNNFPLASYKNLNKGDYIQIEYEILLITKISYSQSNPTGIYVIRGLFGTTPNTHVINSAVLKILVTPVELRRNSILRASGHTFEYTGFGPGNYSTGMPSSQSKVLSSDETLISQALVSNGGLVVYTGMNSNGEFYIGRKKYDASTGEEVVVSGADSQSSSQATNVQSLSVQSLTVNETLDASTATITANTLSANVSITSPTFNGTATNSNNVKIVGLGDETGPNYLLFANGTPAAGSYIPITADSAATYNSDLNILSISGTVSATTLVGAGTIPIGGIIMWSGTQAELNVTPEWKICDGNNGTPDLRNKFIVASNDISKTGKTTQSGVSPYEPGDTGGTANAVVPLHNHTASFTGSNAITGITAVNAYAGGSGFGLQNQTTAAVTGTVDVANAGEAGTNKNLPPYYALAFIMRTV